MSAVAPDAALLALAALPFAGVLAPWGARRAFGADPAWPALAIAMLAFGLAVGLAVGLAPLAHAGDPTRVRLPWAPSLGLVLALRWDGLSASFALLVTATGVLAIACSRWQLAADERTPRRYGLLLAFLGATLGVVLADNLLALVVCWQLTSLVSFLLIGLRAREPASRQAARLALTIAGLGGLALLGATLLIGESVGSYSLGDALAAGVGLKTSGLQPWILDLVLVSAFTTSAQRPFHAGLPRAMAAPTPVSAYLHSATLVGAGVFLLMRLYPLLGGKPEWLWAVATTGTVTLLCGSGLAPHAWRRYRGRPQPATVDRWDGRRVVEELVASLQEGAASLIPAPDAERLQRGLATLVAVALFAGLLGLTGAPASGVRTLQPGTTLDALGLALLFVAVAATLALHRRRAVALAALGAVGLAVALAFARLSAPDLALMQLLVVLVTLLVLRLALRVLPDATPREPLRGAHALHAALALAAGVGGAALAWLAASRPAAARGAALADHSLHGARTAGGGGNVVDALLVDVRGVDTLGAIAVLGIGALAIAALLRGRPRAPAAGDSRRDEDRR